MTMRCLFNPGHPPQTRQGGEVISTHRGHPLLRRQLMVEGYTPEGVLR